MDASLVAWARAVKARHRGRGPPPLWLFTDPAAMPDLVAVVRALPVGLCGVVFRHDGAPGRAALAADVAAVCRVRRLWLVLAGDVRLALRLRAGSHLRGGRRGVLAPGLRTSSAHSEVEVVRGMRAGAAVVFVSPVFPTASHAGARGMGPWRWARLARRGPCAALGGVTGGRVRRLGWRAGMVGAIGALLG